MNAEKKRVVDDIAQKKGLTADEKAKLIEFAEDLDITGRLERMDKGLFDQLAAFTEEEKAIVIRTMEAIDTAVDSEQEYKLWKAVYGDDVENIPDEILEQKGTLGIWMKRAFARAEATKEVQHK